MKMDVLVAAVAVPPDLESAEIVASRLIEAECDRGVIRSGAIVMPVEQPGIVTRLYAFLPTFGTAARLPFPEPIHAGLGDTVTIEPHEGVLLRVS